MKKLIAIIFVILIIGLTYSAYKAYADIYGSGLVGYWSLDSNDLNWTTGQVTDQSGHGNTGQLIKMSTTTSPVVGKIGQALKFNGAALSGGTESRVQTPVTNLSGSGSVSWWQNNSIAFNNNTNTVAVWGQLTSGNTSPDFTNQKFTDGKLYVGWDHCSGSDTRIVLTASATNWPQNKWTLYTLTWVNGGNTILYVNGSNVASQSGTATCNVGDNFIIGNLGRLYSPSSSIGFSGSLDDLRIYNRALSAAEISQLYYTGLGQHAHGL